VRCQFDQHFYNSAQWFVAHDNYYDSYRRSDPKIMVGEYAAQNGPIAQGTATLGTALGEAAWMTGLERNADVVIMASYAPLFQNLNSSHWAPDLISFDAMSSYGSPSYYVQQLFSRNHGDVVASSTIAGGAGLAVVASKVSRSGVVYLTVVNSGSTAQPARVEIQGVASVDARGTATVLTSSSPDDQNSLAAPTKVAPRTTSLSGLGTSFDYRFLPNSVTVLRLTTHG
jgi:alpha-L-arabinofuranosidase